MNVTSQIGRTAAHRTIHASREGNCLTLTNAAPLDACSSSVGEVLAGWAAATPDALFIAERGADQQWRRVSYAEAEAETRLLARKLLALGCSAERPLAVVADNSVDHALLSLAAQRIEVPVAPISLAYATATADFTRLRTMLELVMPGAIFFGDTARCKAAISAVEDLAPVLTAGPAQHPAARVMDGLEPAAREEFDRAARAVGPDTVAKLMFTSGSTGIPKAVINTQRMQCANQAMLRQIWPILGEAPPIMVDWLPWSHTFGSNFTFNMALFNGGALYVDGGKPVPALIGTTIRNLAEIQPTVYFNVPAGYEAILTALRGDDALAARVFARMQFAFCAAAALPQSVFDELRQLAARVSGRPLPIFAGWGSTETAPCATATWWDTDRSDNIGLPLPGVELRFTPDGDKRELVVRGPNVTPGYWRNPEATAAAFDDAGFYRMGDAGKLIDEAAAELGVLFDGRVSENFKLTSGTWVSVGALRVAVVNEGRPVIADVVVAGSGRAEVGLLVFVNHAACAALLGKEADGLTNEAIARHPEVDKAVRAVIAQYNGKGRGSSSRVARCIVLPDAPRIDAYEITDKGYVNQRAVLAARSDIVEQLYADPACRVA